MTELACRRVVEKLDSLLNNYNWNLNNYGGNYVENNKLHTSTAESEHCSRNWMGPSLNPPNIFSFS